MAKVTLDELSSLTNEAAAIATVNNNSTDIEAGFNNTLSRDGTAPNEMEAELDMNDNRITNLADAELDSDAATYRQVQEMAASLGAGNVVGPALSVDNSIALFSGTTGKIIKDSLTSVTDLRQYVSTRTALKALSTSSSTMSVLTESGREGIFVFKSGNYASLVSADTQEGIYIAANDTATTSGAWVRVFNKVVNCKWFGAVGDNTTDDTSALQGALNVGREVFVPPGTYRTTATLTMDSEGQSIFGEMGGNDTSISADHTSGPVIRVNRRQCVIADLTINASNTRNAGSVSSNNHGIMVGDSTGAQYLTSGFYTRLTIVRQPADGFHMTGEGASTILQQVQCNYNRGHGFFFDDGTYDGLATKRRNGIVDIINCRGVENGGNAILLSPAGQTCYRFYIQNFECFYNAWNTAISGLNDFQIQFTGQNIRVVDSAFGDGEYAATTMGNGDTRLAKGAKGPSIRIGSNSTGIHLINNRHLDTSGSVVAFNTIKGLYVRGAYVNATQAIGYDIGTSCTNVFIHLDDSSVYTVPVDSESTGNKLWLDGVEGILVAGSNNAFNLNTTSSSVSISSGVLNCPSDTVLLDGEGGVADTLTTLKFDSGTINLPNGARVRLVNTNSYDITISSGGNIVTPSGVSFPLKQNESVEFVFYAGNAYLVGKDPGESNYTCRMYTGTLADDAATSISVPSNVVGLGMVILGTESTTCLFGWDTIGTYGLNSMAEGSAGAAITQTTGALTGTTGTDGNLTISIHTDNKIYIENRRGSSQAYKLIIFGGL